MQTEIWTILRLITWGADYFKQKGIDSPRLTMELFLAHVLKLRRFDLYMQFDRPLIDAELTELRSMVLRRVAREPLQYIIGEAPFYKRTFEVTPDVLIPRPETELLVHEAIRRSHPLRCLDIGTGSGCIAISIALERPDTEVIGLDVSEAALAVAERNAQRLGARNIRFVHADLFDDAAMRALGSFDLLVANPPYIPAGDMTTLEPEVREHEPSVALTDGGDGLAFYRRIAALASQLLRGDAHVFLELGFGQADQVAPIFRRLEFDVDLLTDLDKVQRILWAHSQRR